MDSNNLPNKSKFIGDVKVIWITGDHRKMKLTESFAYLDPNKKLWEVPKDTVIDGASIPRVFWTIIGGPYEGPYRNASIVHDYYCDIKTEKWQDVHLMFYHACITGGTSIIKAKIMYSAVYYGGPRWEVGINKGMADELFNQKIQYGISEAKMNYISEWIEKNDPSIQEIEDKVNSL